MLWIVYVWYAVLISFIWCSFCFVLYVVLFVCNLLLLGLWFCFRLVRWFWRVSSWLVASCVIICVCFGWFLMVCVWLNDLRVWWILKLCLVCLVCGFVLVLVVFVLFCWFVYVVSGCLCWWTLCFLGFALFLNSVVIILAFTWYAFIGLIVVSNLVCLLWCRVSDCLACGFGGCLVWLEFGFVVIAFILCLPVGWVVLIVLLYVYFICKQLLYINVVDIVFTLFCCFGGVWICSVMIAGFGLVLYYELVAFSWFGFWLTLAMGGIADISLFWGLCLLGLALLVWFLGWVGMVCVSWCLLVCRFWVW